MDNKDTFTFNTVPNSWHASEDNMSRTMGQELAIARKSIILAVHPNEHRVHTPLLLPLDIFLEKDGDGKIIEPVECSSLVHFYLKLDEIQPQLNETASMEMHKRLSIPTNNVLAWCISAAESRARNKGNLARKGSRFLAYSPLPDMTKEDQKQNCKDIAGAVEGLHVACSERAYDELADVVVRQLERFWSAFIHRLHADREVKNAVVLKIEIHTDKQKFSVMKRVSPDTFGALSWYGLMLARQYEQATVVWPVARFPAIGQSLARFLAPELEIDKLVGPRYGNTAETFTAIYIDRVAVDREGVKSNTSSDRPIIYQRIVPDGPEAKAQKPEAEGMEVVRVEVVGESKPTGKTYELGDMQTMVIPPRKEVVAAILAQFDVLRFQAREELDKTIVGHYEARVVVHGDNVRAQSETAVWLNEIKVLIEFERTKFRRWLGQPTPTGDTK